jgi:hypothetical protein
VYIQLVADVFVNISIGVSEVNILFVVAVQFFLISTLNEVHVGNTDNQIFTHRRVCVHLATYLPINHTNCSHAICVS